MNAKKFSFKRVLAAVLSVVMLLGAIPMTASAATYSPNGTILAGTYADKAVLWDVVNVNDNGNLMLFAERYLGGHSIVSNNTTDANQANNKPSTPYAESALRQTVIGYFDVLFTKKEQAAFTDTSLSYKGIGGAPLTETAEVVIPSEAFLTTYFTTHKSATTDRTNTSATYGVLLDSDSSAGRLRRFQLGNGSVSTQGTGAATFAIRPIVTLKAYNYLTVDQIPTGLTLCYAADASNVLTRANTGSDKVTIKNETYVSVNKYIFTGSDAQVVVKYTDTSFDVFNFTLSISDNGTETTISAVDGVFTIPAGTKGKISVKTSVGAADYTAYDEAVTEAKKHIKDYTEYPDVDSSDPSDYTEESWNALKDAVYAPLQRDLTADKQYMIDAATGAIKEAIEKLELRPADFSEYNKAYAKLMEFKEDKDGIYNQGAIYPYADTPMSVSIVALSFSNNRKSILDCNIRQQKTVDDETAAIQKLIDFYPSTIKAVSLGSFSDAMEKLLAASTAEKKYTQEFLDMAKQAYADFSKKYQFVQDEMDIRDQKRVDAATAEVKEFLAKADNYIRPSDPSKFLELYEFAKTLKQEDFYMDDDPAIQKSIKYDVPTNKGEKGGTFAWDTFTYVLKNADNLYSDYEAGRLNAYEHSQDKLDGCIKSLNEAIYGRDSKNEATDGTVTVTHTPGIMDFKRLSDSERRAADIKWFFHYIQYYVDMVLGFFTLLGAALKLLFNGDINIGELIEMLK